MAFKIIYEESTPSRQKMAYYDAIATASGVELKWQPVATDDVAYSDDDVSTPGDAYADGDVSRPDAAYADGDVSAPGNAYADGDVYKAGDVYALLADGTVDGILLNERHGFQQLAEKGFTVVISERGERRLIALFSSFIDFKNTADEPLSLSCSLGWQAEMISRFLSKALPVRGSAYTFRNVIDNFTTDERLYAVLKGEMDVAVFSMADIDLKDPMVSTLRYMVLPLFECPPNIYQGSTALVVKEENQLSSILRDQANREAVRHYHHESFLLNLYHGIAPGIFHMDLPLCSFTYFSGLTEHSIRTGWKMDTEIPPNTTIFSTTEFMKDFFYYEFQHDIEAISKPVIFVASHKAIHAENIKVQLEDRRVWAAGTRTWFELAKQGIWVEGSADGLGLETLIEPWSGQLNISKADVAIITNLDSAINWREDGWMAIGTYRLVPALSKEIIDGISHAGFVFWTSYQQYEACRQYLPPGLIHGSPAGKTAVLLKKDGVKNLRVFPSIKAFSWLLEKQNKQ